MSISNEKSKNWTVTLIDAGDGSGDCLIELPPELLADLHWKVGDTLDTEVMGNQIKVKKVNE